MKKAIALCLFSILGARVLFAQYAAQSDFSDMKAGNAPGNPMTFCSPEQSQAQQKQRAVKLDEWAKRKDGRVVRAARVELVECFKEGQTFAGGATNYGDINYRDDDMKPRVLTFANYRACTRFAAVYNKSNELSYEGDASLFVSRGNEVSEAAFVCAPKQVSSATPLRGTDGDGFSGASAAE